LKAQAEKEWTMKAERRPRDRKGKRNPFCPHYAVCLDEAAKKQWLHLDCSGCDYRSRRDLSPDIAEYAGSDPFPNYTLPYGMDARWG
jgi:hypothetical protein